MEWSGFLLNGLVTVRMDGWKWMPNDGIRFIKHLLIQLCVNICIDWSGFLLDGLLTVCMYAWMDGLNWIPSQTYVHRWIDWPRFLLDGLVTACMHEWNYISTTH